MRIAEMKINNKLIDEAKLNGEIVYRLDRDRTPPEVIYTRLQLYYPLIYPSDNTFPSNTLYPKAERDLHYAKIGDTIYVEFQVSEQLQGNPIITIGTKKFTSNLKDMSNNIYDAYITLTEDMNLGDWQKIQITISNLVDIIGNIGIDVITTGDENYYVIFTMTTPFNLKNIIYNSDFRYNTDGYSSYENANIIGIQDNSLIFKKNDISSTYIYVSCTIDDNLKVNNSYYIRAKFNIDNKKNLGFNDNFIIGLSGSNYQYSIISEEGFQLSSEIHKLKEGQTSLRFGFRYTQANDIKYMIKEMMCVDVTELINSGMTETEIKTLLDNTYFPDLN